MKKKKNMPQQNANAEDILKGVVRTKIFIAVHVSVENGMTSENTKNPNDAILIF